MIVRPLAVLTLTSLLLIGVALPGCGEASGHGDPAVNNVVDGVVEVQIRSDDRMRFDVKRFTVESGQTVRLTLLHVGRMSVDHMGHNVVILQPDETPLIFGRDVGRHGGNMDNHYVPEPMRHRVIAFTAMIGGGDSDTIEFVAPEPGEYPYVCSFPGHYSIMTGVMVVR